MAADVIGADQADSFDPKRDSERAAKVQAWVEERKKAGIQARSSEEHEWKRAWQFYNGFHWSFYDSEGKLREIDDNRPHVTVNYVVHLVLSRMGHLLKNRPGIVCYPGSADEQARNATRLANKAIPAVLERARWSERLREAVRWALVPGKCFLKFCWDFTKGPIIEELGEIEKDDAGNVVMDEATGREKRKANTTRRAGDLQVKVVYPYQIVVDPMVTELDDAPYVIEQSFWPMGQIRRHWPKGEFKANASAAENYSNVRHLRAVDPVTSASPSSPDEEGEVIEAWVKADGELFPDDTYCVIACGQVVELKRWPDGYRDQDRGDPIYPYVSIDDVKNNSFWSSSYARNIVDVNKVINHEVSEQEHVRRVHKPKILVPEQAQVDPDAWDNRPDEIISYWAPHAPAYLKPSELPVHHIESKNWFVNTAKELGGNWDLMGGRSHGEVRSGRQTAYLFEAAGVVLYLVAAQIEDALARGGQIVLRLLQAYQLDEVTEVYVGRNRRAETLHFKGSDLRGAGQVRTQPGSMFPMSRMERYDRIENWMKLQIIPPDVGLRLLELEDFDLPMFESEELDRQNADEAVLMISAVSVEEFTRAGMQSKKMAAQEGMLWNARYVLKAIGIEVFPWENHDLIARHLNNTFRKTRDYRFMPKPLRALVDAYLGWHEAFSLSKGAPIETPLGSPQTVDAVLAARQATGEAVPAGQPPVPVPTPMPNQVRPGQTPPAVFGGTPQIMQPGGARIGQGGVANAGVRTGVPQTPQEERAGLPGIARPRPPGRG